MIVNQQVKVPFSIWTYKDEINCDIVSMEARHILLGRPWQFDRKIIYNGLTNEITLTHLGTKFVLHPQTPSQVAKDQVQIKLKWDEEKNWKIKEEQPLMVEDTWTTLGNQFMGLRTRLWRMHEWQSIHGAPNKIWGWRVDEQR